MSSVTTTASITRGWRKLRTDLRHGLILIVGLWLAASAAIADADVSQLRLERGDDGIYLSADVNFELPAAVEDALVKGIAVYFVAEVELLRDRWYWYDKRIAGSSRAFRLSFQPLTRRWRVQVSANGSVPSGPELTLGQNFDSMADALTAIQRPSRWRIADAADFDASSQHTLSFGFRLDVSKLPRPFQIGALGQSDWNIAVRRAKRVVLEPER